MKRRIECGDIYFLNLKYRFGHEYKGLRPYVVIDSNNFISSGNLICIAPLTSKLSKKRRFDVVIKRDSINNLKINSLVRLDQIDTIDKQCLGHCLGRVPEELTKKIHSNLRKRFNL